MSNATDARWKDHGRSWPTDHRPCMKCNKMKHFSEFHNHKACLFGINTVCKECRKPMSKASYRRTTQEYRLWSSAKSRAKRRGLEFNIEVDDIVIQNQCPILQRKYLKYTDMAPSLDRMDNSKGYIKGNVEVISVRANRMKGDYTMEELTKLLEYIT